MTTEETPDFCITLLHGTWGRGFFPGRPSSGGHKRNGKSLWFEDNSRFRASLTSRLACHELSYKITAFKWSGANSIFERDREAKKLAAHIQSSRAAHPKAMQVVIAHSHGGNIFRVALTHLVDKQKLAVVTMATPFVKVSATLNFTETASAVFFIMAGYFGLTAHLVFLIGQYYNYAVWFHLYLFLSCCY